MKKMNKFKVGQRVYHKELECFVYILSVEDKGYFVYKHKGDKEAFLVANHDLHETADDMFTKLGYERENETPYGFISYIKIINGNKYYVTFRLEEKEYVIGVMKPKIPDAFVCWSNTQLHLAIHQKMIELGYIK